MAGMTDLEAECITGICARDDSPITVTVISEKSCYLRIPNFSRSQLTLLLSYFGMDDFPSHGSHKAKIAIGLCSYVIRQLKSHQLGSNCHMHTRSLIGLMVVIHAVVFLLQVVQ